MALSPDPVTPENGSPADSDRVRAYQVRMKAADSYYKRFRDRAERMVHLYEIDHYWRKGGRGRAMGEEAVRVPIPYANARQILAELYPNDPEPVVKPTSRRKPALPAMPGMPPPKPTHDPIEGAQTLKQAIEYVKRRSDLMPEAKLALLDGIVTGLGIVQIIAQKSSNVPRYERIRYDRVLWAINDVMNPYRSPWIAKKVVRPLDDIQDDESLGANRMHIQTYRLDQSDTQYETKVSEGLPYGCYWELYDKREDLFLRFPDEQAFELDDAVLSSMYPFDVTDDEFKVDWPFEFFINEEMLSSGLGLGDLYPIESLVRELDKTRTQQVEHRKRFNRKYGYRKGVLTAEGMNQLKNPDDGTLVEFNDEITPGNFQAIQDAPLSGDVYRIEETIKVDIQLVQPIGPNSLVHGVGTQPDTLGQSQIIESNANTRLNEKQQNVSRFFARIFRHTAQYIQEYWTVADELLVSGDGTRDADWLSYDPKKVKGEYEYDVAPESLRDNESAYRQQLMQMVQVLAPLMPPGAPPPAPSLAIVLRRLVDNYPTLAKDADQIVPEEWMQAGAPGAGAPAQQPPPDPTDQLAQEFHKDPQGVLDMIQKLPQNEGQTLLAELQKIVQGGGPTAQQGPPAAQTQTLPTVGQPSVAPPPPMPPS